jgi:hypothetical protein
MAAAPRAGRATEFGADFNLGYSGGPGGQAGVTLAHFVQGSPVRARLGIGYASMAPGNAEDAREIFINDNDNGTPEKSGHDWNYRFDFVLPLGKHPSSPWSVYAGPRYSRFTATFKYVGGNEDFDVRAHQWGLGGGLESAIPMNQKLSLRMSGGLDYFFASSLEGHDTAYSPDGEHVNSRKGFEYKDADKAINQPELAVHVLVGVGMKL